MTQLQQADGASAPGGVGGGADATAAAASGGFRAAAIRLWPPTPWEVLAVTTTLLAVAIAVGRVIGIVPIAVLSVVWFVAVGYVVVALGVAKRRWSAAHWVFIAGVGAASLRMCALGLVQLVRGREALFWNVDWRYHATQAYGIARFGGLSDSLDYAGRPVEYHAGPAWIAGALHGTVGAPVNFVLFVLVPLASVVVIGLGGYRFLRFLGVRTPAALLAVAVVVNLPTNPLTMARRVLSVGVVDVVLDPRVWFFTSALMLNSLFALAVGFTAAWMIVGARSHPRAVWGGVCLATVVALKPQYFVGLVGGLAIGLLIGAWQQRNRDGWVRLLVVAGSVLVPAVVFNALNSQSEAFTGVEVAISGALKRNVVTAQSLVFVSVGVLVIVLLVPAFRRLQPPRLLAYAIGAALGALALLFFLDSTTFLLDAGGVARAQATGFNLTRVSYDWDLKQALVPVTLMLAMAVLASLFGLCMGSSRPLRIGALVAACLVIAVTAPFAVSAISDPTGRSSVRWTEEDGLAALYRQVPTDAGVWIGSDMADSAADSSMPLIAVNLTSLSDAQFYLADVQYGGWTQTDVVRRVDNLQRFYSTPWSQWHDDFLRAQGIKFVLVNDRCPANWDPSDFPGRVVDTRGGWTLLEVDRKQGSSSSAERPWPAYTGKPTSGQSECLSGRPVS